MEPNRQSIATRGGFSDLSVHSPEGMDFGMIYLFGSLFVSGGAGY